MKKQHPTLGNGKICYLEIPAVDVNGSALFYKEVFGWNIRKRGDGEISFDDGVGEVSGTWVTGKKPDYNPGIIIHIMVNDALLTMDLIKIHGGKIVQEIGAHAPEITAKFSDPAGNVLSIYQEPSQSNQ